MYVNDCLSYIQTILHNYDGEKGKAYSYISICVRNYVWRQSKMLSDRNKRFVSGDTKLDEVDDTIFDAIADTKEPTEILESQTVNKMGGLLLKHWTRTRIRECLYFSHGFDSKTSYTASITIRSLLERHFGKKKPAKYKSTHMPTYRTMELIKHLVADSQELFEKNGIEF